MQKPTAFIRRSMVAAGLARMRRANITGIGHIDQRLFYVIVALWEGDLIIAHVWHGIFSDNTKWMEGVQIATQ
ncbi:MAG: hypothetical protein JSS86_08545 [Cyanobacteria bacterium SZAS LIN-2]|nr:hypothetical protein [Cyanobacteria bacterium SZAS LIN-2]